MERDIAPLPVPYEAPWRRLADDLQAVLAGAGLKLRELARLNGEGRLSRPGFWPTGLAPLFWPLVLTLGAALLVGLLVAGQAALARRQPAALAGATASSSWAAPKGSAPEPLAPAASEALEALEALEGAEASEGSRALKGANSSKSAQASAGAQTEGSRTDPQLSPLPQADPAPPAPLAPADRLADLRRDLLGAAPPPWVLEIQEQPAAALLQLRVGPEFARLPEPQRRALAEQWLERAQQRGYECLELLDPAGAVLARPARVGSGMILLDSLPPSP